MPKAFISYSWDDQAHKSWVHDLAVRLRSDGVDVTLDQWHAAPGDQLPAFMDKAIRENDFVLIVCTPRYKLKADGGLGGVGFEGDVMLGHIFTTSNHRKFIPVLRKGEWELAAPSALLGKFWIDLREGPDYEQQYQQVLRTLLGQREQAPRVGGPTQLFLPDITSTTVIGRTGYVEILRAALVPKPGMFLLSGEPGSGKSTLALMFAYQAAQDFDALVFQPCGQRAPEAIVTELAETLREQLGEAVVTLSSEEKLKAVKKWLKQRRSLFVLDDVWLAETASSLKVQDLLPGPPVSVLFTSRLKQLPWLRAADACHVESFTPEEAEAVFREYLGAETFNRHRESLLQFAGRMERLPIAVSVGAELLRREFGPLDQAARGLALTKLRNEVHDVSGLLQRAIEAQDECGQRLLAAAAVCAAEGFWLPLAGKIAGLYEAEAETARNHLANASLLRMLDRDRQRFQLHALLREQLRSSSTLNELQEAHAQALEDLFRDWEGRWRDCRECLPEILPAAEFLWNLDVDRGSWLSYWAYSVALRTGELDTALRIEQQDERIWSDRQDSDAHIIRDGLQRSYGNQAVILRRWGRLQEAMELLKKQEAICAELGKQEGLQATYGNQALILSQWGQLEEAMALHKKQEAVCEELGDQDSLQRSYGNQANILKVWGRLEEAMALHKKQEAVCEELGAQDSLQHNYGNQALILQEWGRLEEAMELHKKEEAICKELGDKDGLQHSYGNQALILRRWGRLEEAMEFLKKQEAICAELGNRDSLAHSYANQALILQARGRLEEAVELLKKQEAICTELGNQEGLGYCYYYLGLVAREMGDPHTEKEKLQASLAIFTKLKMPRERDEVQATLNRAQANAVPAE
jgi:tetratricopeptide (TPR) repeat protein